MWRQQLSWDQIADSTIQTQDIKNWTVLLEDLSQEVLDELWGWWTQPAPFKEDLVVTNKEYSPSDMTYTPNDYNLLQVYLNWQLQREWTDEDYTVSWRTITFVDKLKKNNWREDKVTVIYYY